jgi:hypothetical protein
MAVGAQGTVQGINKQLNLTQLGHVPRDGV